MRVPLYHAENIFCPLARTMYTSLWWFLICVVSSFHRLLRLYYIPMNLVLLFGSGFFLKIISFLSLYSTHFVHLIFIIAYGSLMKLLNKIAVAAHKILFAIQRLSISEFFPQCFRLSLLFRILLTLELIWIN